MKMSVVAEGQLTEHVSDDPLLFVSDLHMGAGDKADNFLGQDDLFLQFIDRFPNHEIVIVGDGFDGWENPDAWTILLAHGAVILALGQRARSTVRIHGNHDGDRTFWESLPREGWKACDIYGLNDLLAEHGHRLDPACSGPGTWIGRRASAAWGWIERKGWAPRFEWLRRLVTRWNDRRRATFARTAETNARYVREFTSLSAPWTVWVTGHTHRPQLVEHPRLPGHFYANPGSWVERGRGYAVLIAGKQISLVEVIE